MRDDGDDRIGGAIFWVLLGFVLAAVLSRIFTFRENDETTNSG